MRSPIVVVAASSPLDASELQHLADAGYIVITALTVDDVKVIDPDAAIARALVHLRHAYQSIAFLLDEDPARQSLRAAIAELVEVESRPVTEGATIGGRDIAPHTGS